MKILLRKKLIDISLDEFKEVLAPYKKVILDVGTGDGKNLIKSSLKYPDHFYIGLDSSIKNLDLCARELNRKKLENVMLINSAAEMTPSELIGIADEIQVLFPWGSLLEGVASGDISLLTRFHAILKSKGILTVIFGYSSESDPSVNLPQVDIHYIKNLISKNYQSLGFHEKIIKLMSMEDLALTSWGARLIRGKSRTFFLMQFQKSD